MVESSKSIPPSNCKELLTLGRTSTSCSNASFVHIQVAIPQGHGFQLGCLIFTPNQGHLSLYPSFSWDVLVTIQGILKGKVRSLFFLFLCLIMHLKEKEASIVMSLLRWSPLIPSEWCPRFQGHVPKCSPTVVLTQSRLQCGHLESLVKTHIQRPHSRTGL